MLFCLMLKHSEIHHFEKSDGVQQFHINSLLIQHFQSTLSEIFSRNHEYINEGPLCVSSNGELFEVSLHVNLILRYFVISVLLYFDKHL